MTAYDLGQKLIVPPETPFSQIALTLEGGGWSRDPTNSATVPLVAGEPELVTWSWNGRKPFVVYTFNPVVRLRVLDVNTVPPSLRAAIAGALDLVGLGELQQGLSSPTPRERLHALWAVQETEIVELATVVDGLHQDTDPKIAGEARNVSAKLSSIIASRIEALTEFRFFAEAARDVVGRFAGAAFVQKLLPTRDECGQLFDAEFADRISADVSKLFQRRMTIQLDEPYVADDFTAASAAIMRWPNELSDKFPRAYRQISGWMEPTRIWVTWAYKSPTGGAVRYDGLAWVNDRWVWIPKPFRIVGQCIDESMRAGAPAVNRQ